MAVSKSCTVSKQKRDIGRRCQFFIPLCVYLAQSLAVVCCVGLIIKKYITVLLSFDPIQPIENCKISTRHNPTRGSGRVESMPFHGQLCIAAFWSVPNYTDSCQEHVYKWEKQGATFLLLFWTEPIQPLLLAVLKWHFYRLKGHSSTSEITPFDKSHTSSCSSSIVTMAIMLCLFWDKSRFFIPLLLRIFSRCFFFTTEPDPGPIASGINRLQKLTVEARLQSDCNPGSLSQSRDPGLRNL